jgi:putative transposase
MAQVARCDKGKSAIHLARVDAGGTRNLVGQHFGARGYRVSTVGRDEACGRRCIQERAQQLKQDE